MNDLKKHTGDIMELALAHGGECEMFMESFNSFSIEVHRGEVEAVERAGDSGVGIRYFQDGRVGYSYTTGFDPDKLREAFHRARENSAFSSISRVDILPEGSGEPEEMELYPDLPSGEFDEDRVEDVLEMEETAYRYDPVVINTDGVIYEESRGVVAVAGSGGWYRQEERGYCYCSIMSAARKNGETRSGWSYGQAQSPELLNFNKTGRESASRAADLLGSRQIETGRYSVLFAGEAFAEIIGLAGEALSGENVVRGASFMGGRAGAVVASIDVNILDHPHLKGGCFNAGFDAEGISTAVRPLIEKGRLKEYLHHTKSAALYGRGNPGNAVRASFRERPSPGPTNLYLLPDDSGKDNLVKQVDSGIMVRDIMGVHTADTVSGDFSLGIRGRQIRGGRLGRPFTEMTISGNLLELLGNIRLIGGRARFAGNCGSPDVLVADLSVSGN